MGDVADDMLDGTCCQVCGEFNADLLAHLEKHSPGGGECTVPWEPPGYPITCGGCGGFPDAEVVIHVELNAKPPKTIPCPESSCERKFRSREAAAQHWVAKHE